MSGLRNFQARKVDLGRSSIYEDEDLEDRSNMQGLDGKGEGVRGAFIVQIFKVPYRAYEALAAHGGIGRLRRPGIIIAIWR